MLQHDFDEEINRRGTCCKKWDLYPEDILPMFVADTDFKTAQPVIDALVAKAQHGVFGYTNVEDGGLEKAAALWMKKRFGWEFSPEQVVFTPAIGTVMSFMVTTFTQPGEGVVLLTPLYPSFTSAVVDNGRVPFTSSLQWKNGRYEIDFADLEQKINTPRVRMLMLCNPHNPTGRAFTREELLRIGGLCLKHKVMLFVDEIHGDLVYAEHGHTPFPTLSPELADICLVSFNPSKTFNTADFRSAVVVSHNEQLLDRYRATIKKSKLGRVSMGIAALEIAYTKCDYYADQAATYLRRNMEYAVARFAQSIPAVKTYMPDATYLLWLDCRAMGMNGKDLHEFFMDKAKIAFSNGRDFGIEGEGFMRMNCGCTMATLKKALSQIERAVAGLS